MTGQPIQFDQRYSGLPKPDAVNAKHAALVKQTQKWVAQTFFGQMLKQMRESPFKSDLFSGGRGGQAFAEMYDQELADHMARGAGSKLVNAIVGRIESGGKADSQLKIRDGSADSYANGASGIQRANAYLKQSKLADAASQMKVSSLGGTRGGK